jgi:hypothetical protein
MTLDLGTTGTYSAEARRHRVASLEPGEGAAEAVPARRARDCWVE